MLNHLHAAVHRLVVHQKRLCSARNPNAFVNHYAVLGVPAESHMKDIQAAYYRLAKALHPDANPGRNTNQQFAQINVAYSILSNPHLRRRFDQTLTKLKGTNATKVSRARESKSSWSNYYSNIVNKKKSNRRKSSGDIGTDRDMEWQGHDEETYSVYWTEALDAWHLQHHIHLDQVDPWALKPDLPEFQEEPQ